MARFKEGHKYLPPKRISAYKYKIRNRVSYISKKGDKILNGIITDKGFYFEIIGHLYNNFRSAIYIIDSNDEVAEDRIIDLKCNCDRYDKNLLITILNKYNAKKQ